MSVEHERTCKTCGTTIKRRNYVVVNWRAGAGGHVCEDCAKVIGIQPQKPTGTR